MPAASPPWTWPSATSGLMIRPRVVAGDHPDQADRAGLGVDLDDRDVGAEGERRLVGLEVGLGAELGQSAVLLQPPGQLGPAQRRLGGARHVEGAGVEVEHHVLGVGLQRVGGELLGAVDEDLRGLAGGGAADLGRLGAVGAGAARHPVGVAGQHLDLVQVDAGALGHDLGERGLVALAVGEGPGADDRAAVLGDLDGAELALADAVGDLDVDGDADAEQHMRTVGAPLLPGRGAAPRSRRARARAPGRPRSRRCRRSRRRRSGWGTSRWG